MKRNKIKLFTLLVTILFAMNSFIVIGYLFPATSGMEMNGTLKWTSETEEFVEETFGDCTTDLEKVNAFREWIIENIRYTPYSMPLLQVVNVDKTIASKTGICFEQASLFTIFCRIEGIECYNVDGRLKNNFFVCHSWNRFCVNGQWYDIDITNDQTALTSNQPEFGFVEVDGKNAKDSVFNIYRIY
jgi:transglutaminase-like putative cysteine protease